jgi:pimeloyl-ACP methyl ester carboxylesterase
MFEQAEQAAAAGDLDRANDLEVHIWVDGPGRTPEMVNPSVRERVREMNLIALRRGGEHKQATRREPVPPANDRLSAITAPTLVIVGDQDVSDISLIADRIAAGIPDARKVVMRDTAHVPPMERPAEFNRLLLDFLAEHNGK